MSTAIIATIARPALRLGVSASSASVDLVGRMLGEQGNDRWGPALAVEGLQATVLTTAGDLLGDERFSAQGRLLAEKVDRLRSAEILEGQAANKLAEAEEQRAAREQAAADQREQAAAAAEEKKAAAARRARDQKRAAKERAGADAAAAEKAQQDAEQRIERQQRTARTEAVAIEREAVAKEKAAAAAARKAAASDARIKAVNQARKG